MATGFEIVDGKLTHTDGSQRNVRLRLTTQSAMEGSRVIDKMVSETALMSSDVSDGDYVLEYFYLKAYRDPVRVRFGHLLSRPG
jgi:hypothetical protein